MKWSWDRFLVAVLERAPHALFVHTRMVLVALIAAIVISVPIGILPVSYTHLDVYKRQRSPVKSASAIASLPFVCRFHQITSGLKDKGPCFLL